MKDSKGITLASLVVMITSIILLSTIAISFGYRYLKETKEADEKYFKEVLSVAVTKRENNHTVNQTEYPRIGYKINKSGDFDEIVKKYVPSLQNVNTELLYERGHWYIVDTNTAESLGVKDSKAYIDVYDNESSKKMKVAMIDYKTGAVYVFTINGAESIKNIISGDIVDPNDGHEHQYNIPEATCTEDRRCTICGYVIEVALGHDYGGEMAATPLPSDDPQSDEFHYKKACKRPGCGAKGGYERHKDLDKYAFYQSGDGTWYHYNGCSDCEWPTEGRNYEECSIVWKSISDTQHVKYCRICENEEVSGHEFKWVYVDEQYHEQVCTICGFKMVKYENHIDEDNNNICDKCACEIIKIKNPILVEVTIRDKEYPNSKYVTNYETIQVIFTADKMIKDANVTICGYGGDNIKYTYSGDRRTCIVAELYVDEDITIAQNTEITFSIDCKSVTTGEGLIEPMTSTTDDSYLIYDSIAPIVEYISKDSY